MVAEDSLFDGIDEDGETVFDPDELFEEHDLPPYPAIGKLGRFELLGRIAMGGMAEIFLAREQVPGGPKRHVVIKRVLSHVAGDEDFIRMFLDEIRICKRLYHPNICHVYEGGEDKGTYFMAMEWVYGVPLRRLLRRSRDHGGIAVGVAAKIVSLIAEALHYVHNAADPDEQPLSIIHRDVNPHNVMISYRGEVKLLDFGIAKAATSEEQTAAGVIKGKYSYMSPEQCIDGAIDRRSDIFALGVSLFETATCKPLYHRGVVMNTMQAIVREPVPSARDIRPDVPFELDQIIRRALAKDPADRFQTAREMHLALEDFLRGQKFPPDNLELVGLLNKVFPVSEREPIPTNQPTDPTPARAKQAVRHSKAPTSASVKSGKSSKKSAEVRVEHQDDTAGLPPPPEPDAWRTLSPEAALIHSEIDGLAQPPLPADRVGLSSRWRWILATFGVTALGIFLGLSLAWLLLPS